MLKIINKYLNLPNVKFEYQLFMDHWIFWTVLTIVLALTYLKISFSNGGIKNKINKS